MKEKSIAIVLAFFMGGLGGHHFYLGNTGRGILYAVFCWSFIPSLVAIVEGTYFATMSGDDFNQKFNSDYIVIDYKAEHDRYSGLEKIAELKQNGVITEEEFQKEKAKLVS